jgi:hypothetical protein
MEKQEQFILNSIWSMTTSAAFQRANIYNVELKDSTATQKRKVQFKNELYAIVNDLLPVYRQEGKMDDAAHCNAIQEISNYQNDLLANGHLNFGIAQKILNLYLKFLWCMGKIPMPPHCPVDRMIQEKLKISVVNWTTDIISDTIYLAIIQRIRDKAQGEPLATFELEVYGKK